MKSAWIIAALAIALPACAQQAETPKAFSVTVTDADGGRFSSAHYASGHGCTGENLSPAIAWQGAPAGTRSFAVTIFDPDAPAPGAWHWLASGIPVTSKGLEAGISRSPALSAIGVTEGTNGFGATGYGGPCPPQGQDHRYVVTVHALGVESLALPAVATPAELEAAIASSTIAKAETTLRASR